MSDPLWNGGSPWGNGAFQSLDQKIVRVEGDLRAEIGEVRREIREGIAGLGEKLDRSLDRSALERSAARETSGNGGKEKGGDKTFVLVSSLIGTAIGIITLLGSWFGYVSNTLDSKIADVKAAVEVEEKLRSESQRSLFEKTVSKDAFVEYAKRIDEVSELEQKYNEKMLAKFDSELVPRTENDQRWKDQSEDIGRLERQLSNSLDRVVEHLNKSDETSANKFTELEKVVHGYGLGDEVKDLQTQVRNGTDKLFDLISKLNLGLGSSSSPPAK